MKSIVTVYRYCNALSLDVSAGAVICAAFFARILEVQLRPFGLASLGLTVWIIYTADHLLDARKVKQQASSERHRFHQSNFSVLVVVVVVAALVDFVMIFFVRKPILNWGMGLSIVVVAYLLIQSRLMVFKELIASLLYSAGVLLPALALTEVMFSSAEITLIFVFTMTAFINLVLFSWYDWKDDLMDKHSSLVTNLGRNRVKNILFALFLIQSVLLGSIWLTSSYHFEVLILTTMNLPLLILVLFPATFSGENLYRFVGDIVFIFPLVYFI